MDTTRSQPPPTPAAPATSIYETAGRAKKVLRLCMAIDAGLDMGRIDPFSAQALEIVLAMSREAWRIAAEHARVPLASITTQRMIEDLYRQRVEVRACLAKIA